MIESNNSSSYFAHQARHAARWKTDVFGYEPELPLACAVEEKYTNISFLCPQSFVHPSTNFMGGPMA